MIAFIKGKVHQVSLDGVIIETSGLGYHVYFARPELLHLNEEVFLYTYHYVREDEQSLYGFLTQEAYELFLRLISVKGVGCKTANAIFGAATSAQLIQAIEQADVAFLKKMPGIGAKTAQQIILDLKGKLVSEPIEKAGQSLQISETLDALKQLGYKAGELSFLVKTLNESADQSTDALLKTALKLLNQRKG